MTPRPPVCVNLADLRDPNDPEGRTYRQINAAKTHAIPVGTLVEIVSAPGDDRWDGVRVYVVHQGRDCDMTPLYWLAMNRRDTEEAFPGFGNRKWQGGFPEDSLRVVKESSETGAADSLSGE